MSKEPVKFSISSDDSDLQATSSSRYATRAFSDRDRIEEENENDMDNENDSNKSAMPIFKKIWETKLANPIKCVQYSPDGTLFASFGEVSVLIF